jgi:hypothetical protein
MADLFDDKQIISVPTGFQAFFGNPANAAQTLFSPDSNVVDIDIIRGNERIAALIPRGLVSRPLGSLQKNQKAENYSSFSRKYPLSEEEGDITADQLNFRVGGENPYSARTRMDRMRHLALKHHHESIRRTVRMFEVLSAQSILEGVQDSIIGTSDTDLQYDFRRKATHIGDVTTGWNQATATIMADIDGACDKIRQDAFIKPDFIGIGGSAMDAFINDTDVQAQADNRRFELIEVSTNNPVPSSFDRFVAAGWTARGRLRTPKGYELWIFTYIDGYTDSGGTFTPYLPVDNAIIAASESRCDRYFGPPENLPMISQRATMYRELFGFDPSMPPMPPRIKDPGNIILPAMFYCDAYVANDNKKVTVRTQSAPIFATTQTDAFVTLTGLVT